MEVNKKRIGALLVENAYVTAEQVRRALEVQKTSQKRLGNILIELGYLTEHKFHEFLSTIEGMASIELGRYEIAPDIIKLLPREIALLHEVVPIGRIRNLLTVAMVCPLDQVGLKKLEDVTGLKVKAVLCSRRAVYYALDRYYQKGEGKGEQFVDNTTALDVSMELRRVGELVLSMQDLPTLPDILRAVSAIVNDPASSAADLAKVISTDTALSAKILKLANSPAYGFTRKVADIKYAVALLGFKETQALAVSVSAFQYISKGGHFDFKSHWNHSYACATLARILATHAKHKEAESAFVAGLLHDIGKAAFATDIFRDYRARQKPATPPIIPSELDEENLGITHAEFGYLLAEHWLLPPVLTHAIRYHHMPELEPAPRGLASIIYLADHFSDLSKTDTATTAAFGEDAERILGQLNFAKTSFSRLLDIYRDVASDISIF